MAFRHFILFALSDQVILQISGAAVRPTWCAASNSSCCPVAVAILSNWAST